MSLDTAGGIPPSPGRMNVDFEERVDFTRLRAYRLERAREALDASELGAVLLFDINNIRYVSATMIGEWARDKVARYALLTREHDENVFTMIPHNREQFQHDRAGILARMGRIVPGHASEFSNGNGETRSLNEARNEIRHGTPGT